MKKSFQNKFEIAPKEKLSEVHGYRSYSRRTKNLDPLRVDHFQKMERSIKKMLNKIFGAKFVKKAFDGNLSAAESQKANVALSENLYSKKISLLIQTGDRLELANLSKKNIDKFATDQKVILSHILADLDVNVITIRPEAFYLSEKIEMFLEQKGFYILFSKNLRLSFSRYWALYDDSMAKMETWEDFPTRTLVYMSEKCKIIVFSKNENTPHFSRAFLKGERGNYEPGTLRGDLITKESLYLFNNGPVKRNKMFFILDPISSYRNIINGEIPSDEIHKKFKFPFLFYSFVGIHSPDREEISRDLYVLLTCSQMREILDKKLSIKNKNMSKILSKFNKFKSVRNAECDVFLLQGKNKKSFLKIKNNESKNNFIFESEIYDILGRKGAKVPRVLCSDYNFVLTSAIQGKHIDDRPWLFSRKKIFADVTKDFLTFYSIDFTGFGPIENMHGKYQSWLDFFKVVPTWLSELESSKRISKKDVLIIRDYWKRNNAIIKTVKESHLVHGDFCLEHIFTFKNQYSGIIDFGDAFAGDPLMDIAYFRFKEITKDYGETTYNNLLKNIRKNITISERENILINLYMIYWGLERTLRSKDDSLSQTFAKKMAVLADKL